MGPELGTELVPLPWLGDVVLTSDHYPATGQVRRLSTAPVFFPANLDMVLVHLAWLLE